MGNLVKYGSYSPEAAAAEEADLDKGSADFMKLEVGRSVVRFLPPPVGKQSPFRVLYQHYIDVPGAKGPLVFVCPRMEAKSPCPACAQADKYRKSGNPADREKAKDYSPSRRVMANVIDRKNPEQGPKVLGIGKTIHEGLIALRKDEDAGGDFTDPEKGFDVIIERTGTTKNDTKYRVLGARKQSPLASTEEQMVEWIEGQKDLDALAQVKSSEDIVKMLSGESVDSAGKGSSGSKGSSSSKGSKRTAEDDAIDGEFEKD